MSKILLPIALLILFASSVATASPAVGDLVRYRTATSQYHLAVVGRVVSGTTVDIVAFSDGTTWQDMGTPPGAATITYYGLTLGTGVGQYQPTTIVADAAAAAGFATTSATSAAIASSASALNGTITTLSGSVSTLSSTVAALSSSSATHLVQPIAPATAGLSLGGVGVQLSATRAVLLTVRGTASMTSTLAGGQAFGVELRCDSGSTPTTVVDDASGALSQTLGISVTLTAQQPWKLVTIARPGDFCRVVSGGTATVSLSGSSKQAL